MQPPAHDESGERFSKLQSLRAREDDDETDGIDGPLQHRGGRRGGSPELLRRRVRASPARFARVPSAEYRAMKLKPFARPHDP